MGHIDKKIVDGITVFTVTGAIQAQAVVAEIAEFLAHEPTRLVIWDIMQADLRHVTARDWRMIVDRIGPASAVRVNGRTAIISDSDVNFGMSRMLQSLAEGAKFPVSISVFRTAEAAHRWLAEAS